MYFGEIIALSVAVCWTSSAVFFELAGRKIGSISVNIIRLGVSFILLGITLLFTQHAFIPMDVTAEQWFWLGLSGVIGLYLGVSLSLLAIQHTKTGIASTFMALVPIFVIIPSAIIFKEKIRLNHFIGAIVSVIGVALFFL